MAEVLIAEDSLDDILRLVSELAEQTLTAANGVSVSLTRDGNLVTAAHSKEFAKEIDEKQYSHGGGPCVQATSSGDEVGSFPLDVRKWPGLKRLAEKNGVGGIYSIPLKVHAESIGALNIYCKERTAPSDEQLDLGRLLAQQASTVLANAKAYLEATRYGDQLQEALKSREVIGQAKGILMERDGYTPDEAFDKLKKISQHGNVKLRDVAQLVVDSIRK